MTYGIAMKTATNSDSLNGVRKGDMTVVAMSWVPLGSLSFRGVATNVKIRLELSMHGMNASPTAISARISRSRSSSRCEISVPSASFSGSSLMGLGPRRIGGALRGRIRARQTAHPVLLARVRRGRIEHRRGRWQRTALRVGGMGMGVRVGIRLGRIGRLYGLLCRLGRWRIGGRFQGWRG